MAVLAPSGDEIYTVERGMAFPVSLRVEGTFALIALDLGQEAPEDGLIGRGAIDETAPSPLAAITPGGDRSVDRIDGPPSIW